MVKSTKQQKKSNRRRRRLARTKLKRIGLQKALKEIKQYILKKKPYNLGDAIRLALSAAKQLKSKIKPGSRSRVIQIPKVGGVLPLIPIFAALSAMGSLGGAAAGIAKAVNDTRAAKKQLEEANRHNRTMESIAMGKGLYLKPYKTGLGVFLRPAAAAAKN